MDYKAQTEKIKKWTEKWTDLYSRMGYTVFSDFLREVGDYITDLLARAEAAEARAEKAERDAAVEQLRGDCEKCEHYRVTWNGCTPDYECPLSDRCLNRDLWEWDGGQKEE